MDRVAGSLNERCNDLTHLQIEADTGELTSLEERVKRDTVNMLREAESYSVPGHYIDGSRRLLDQPEFSQGSRARELVELVEEQVLLEGIICETPPDGDVVVYIGGENRQVSLRPFGSSSASTAYPPRPAAPSASWATPGHCGLPIITSFPALNTGSRASSRLGPETGVTSAATAGTPWAVGLRVLCRQVSLALVLCPPRTTSEI